MRYSLEIGRIEYEKINKYLKSYGYISEPTGSIRRGKEDIGDIDIVVTSRGKNNKGLEVIEREVLDLIVKYSEIKERINYYEFELNSGISIHMIPEITENYRYTLWHSTGPKPHVKMVKEIYKERELKIRKEEAKEMDIYIDIGIEYIDPKNRYKFTERESFKSISNKK